MGASIRLSSGQVVTFTGNPVKMLCSGCNLNGSQFLCPDISKVIRMGLETQKSTGNGEWVPSCLAHDVLPFPDPSEQEPVTVFWVPLAYRYEVVERSKVGMFARSHTGGVLQDSASNQVGRTKDSIAMKAWITSGNHPCEEGHSVATSQLGTIGRIYPGESIGVVRRLIIDRLQGKVASGEVPTCSAEWHVPSIFEGRGYLEKDSSRFAMGALYEVAYMLADGEPVYCHNCRSRSLVPNLSRNT